MCSAPRPVNIHTITLLLHLIGAVRSLARFICLLAAQPPLLLHRILTYRPSFSAIAKKKRGLVKVIHAP